MSGGRKPHLALFRCEGRKPVPIREQVFPSARYGDLKDLVREFLSPASCDLEAAVFGIAGPVVGGPVKLTNLSWLLDQKKLSQDLAVPKVFLVNDVLATAAAIPHLGSEAFFTLQEGQEDPKGNVAVVAPGTGLGEAFLTRSGERGEQWRAHATEGGHTDFAPRNDEELALGEHLRRSRKRISAETVCAGSGIERIYRYLCEVDPGEAASGDLTLPIDTVDVVPRIVEASLRRDEPCPLCVRTLRFYVSLLGAEAGNLALKVMATGGVYLGGGIPPRILPFLQEAYFLRSFHEKGRMSDLMARIPVRIILEPRAALLGTAYWFWENENRDGHFDRREKS